jgi:hypothetical protein
VSAAGDALDGYLARSRGQVSVLGKFLDPLADKLIVTAVLVFMVALGRVPAWLVVVMIARDLAVNGLRSIASAEGLVIAASEGGKVKTACSWWPSSCCSSTSATRCWARRQRRLPRRRDDHPVAFAGDVSASGLDYLRKFVAVLTRQPDLVIALDVPPLASPVARRRRAGGRARAGCASPGDGDLGLERELVACDPVRVVRGSPWKSWRRVAEARAAWAGGPGTPVGVGYLSYDLGRRLRAAAAAAAPPSPWPTSSSASTTPSGCARRHGQTQIWASATAAAERAALAPGAAAADDEATP